SHMGPSSCPALYSHRIIGNIVQIRVAPSFEIYALSLHDALPICPLWNSPRLWMIYPNGRRSTRQERRGRFISVTPFWYTLPRHRSEEHTSELQSRENLVCRLLLEKKKYTIQQSTRVIYP